MDAVYSPEETVYLEENVEIINWEEIPTEDIAMNTKLQSCRVSDYLFATAMKKCGSILFEKKRTTTVKNLKKAAVKKIIQYIESQRNCSLSEDQVYKKMYNMKSRIKSKRELNQNTSDGILNEGEQIFCEVMDTFGNPVAADETREHKELAVRPSGEGSVSQTVMLTTSNLIIQPGLKTSLVTQSPILATIFQDVNTTTAVQSSVTSSCTSPDLVTVIQSDVDSSFNFNPASMQSMQSNVVMSSNSMSPAVVTTIQSDGKSSSNEKSTTLNQSMESNEMTSSDADPSKKISKDDKPDWSKLHISELEKLVLMKKLDSLEVKKRFYEKAYTVLEKIDKILD